MYLSIPSALFQSILATAKLTIPSKTTLPILQSLHFEVTSDGLTLLVTSTNLDLSLVQTYPLAEQGAAGTACIPLRSLAAIRPDKNTPVRIHTYPYDPENTIPAQVHYVSGGFSAKAEADTHDPDQFPLPKSPPPEDFGCLLPGRTFTAITTALTAASTDQTRYVLNGVLLSAKDGGAVVATDGRRLIKIRSKATPADCILPTKLCQLLVKLKPGSASCALQTEILYDGRAHGTQISLRLSASMTVHSKLVEGNFPNYGQVIPQDSNSSITFTDPAAVAAWLARLPEQKQSNSVTLTPRAPHFVDLTHATGSITTTAYLANEPGRISFNPSFMADCLTAVGGTLYLIDHESPGVFRSPTALAVLMPMRVTVEETPAQAPAAA